jgi:hypothetical protein
MLQVNAYAGPGDGDLPQRLWDNLIALVYFRATGSSDSLDNMRDFREHLRDLGKEVPMFAVNSESQDESAIQLWREDEHIDLLHPHYNLEEVPLADGSFP